jgi:hypothetical protein
VTGRCLARQLQLQAKNLLCTTVVLSYNTKIGRTATATVLIQSESSTYCQSTSTPVQYWSVVLAVGYAVHDWPRAPAAPSQATALEAHVRLCLCLSTYRKSYTMTMDSWTCACATLTHSKQRSSTSCPAFSLPPLLKSSLLLRYAPPAF